MRTHELGSAATVEIRSSPLRPRILARRNARRAEACNSRCAIGANQDVLLREDEPVEPLEAQD